ncbi:hypothetical protein [Pedococcus bigeumensis]|uniref:hypothetical protein n=1 Tax=Pedococcus bigeumensis TaxID=433644 RepID=UPI0031D9D633
MDSPLVTPDRTHGAQLPMCACGTSLTQGVHRTCTGDAAIQHSARVEDNANQLLARLRAIVLMGTLDGELRPLSV